MGTYGRPYRDGGDLARMRELLMVGTAAGIPASYMHPGELYWMTYYPPDEEANRRDIRVWEFAAAFGGGDRDELAAWAIYCALEETFDLFVHPSLHGTAHARGDHGGVCGLGGGAGARGGARPPGAVLGDGL